MNPLQTLIATLDKHGIEPLTLTYQHYRTDSNRLRWSIHVHSCQEFRTLCREWHGKRDDRIASKTLRTMYADCGPEGLLSHVCHVDMPCWGSTEADDNATTHEYDSDLFGGDAA